MDINNTKEARKLLEEYDAINLFIENLTSIDPKYVISITGLEKSNSDNKKAGFIPPEIREDMYHKMIEAATDLVIERQRRIEQL